MEISTMQLDGTVQQQTLTLLNCDRGAWHAMLDALPPRLRHFETCHAGRRIDGKELTALLSELLNACGGDAFEWISMQSPRPSARWGTLTSIPADWATVYRWLEVSVVHGSSEGWLVHVRGVLRARQDDGLDPTELLLTAKCFDRHYAWRAAQLFSEFFDC